MGDSLAVELEFTHPNALDIYHREIYYDIPLEVYDKIVELLNSEELLTQLDEDNCLDENTPIARQLKKLLKGCSVLRCAPRVSLPVYWKAPKRCACRSGDSLK